MATVIGGFLFISVFVLMTPGVRAFLLASMAGATAWLNTWAPLSFVVLGFVVMAPMISIFLLKTWPPHVEPENPMSKYRRDPGGDGE